MDFGGITIDTSSLVNREIAKVLALSISPANKELLLTKLLRDVGLVLFGHMFDVSSAVFGSEVIAAGGLVLGESQTERLSNKIVRNYSLGRLSGAVVKEYYDSILAKAQAQAFENAVSLDRHPTLTRTSGPKPDCAWCLDKMGTKTNPQPEDFRRHNKCDCILRVSGYGSRNGDLNNFKKVKK